MFRVDVTAATDREQTSIEFHIVRLVFLKFGQPLVIGKGYLLAIFTTAKVQSLPLEPMFGTDFFRQFLQCLVTIFALVLNSDVFFSINLSYLVIGNIAHSVIDCLHNQLQMFPRRRSEREYRFILSTHRLEYKKALQQVFYAVELYTILPLDSRLLFGLVLLHEPIAFTEIVHIIIDIKSDILCQGKGEGKHILALYLLYLRTAIIGRHVHPLLLVSVIYGHILMVFL